MGSTLEHGIYLPSEGEKNCYQGLAGNWNKVDGALGDVAGLKQLIESKFTKEIVTELPTEDINPYCIYMILKTDPETNNIYDEWVYINNAWEYLGNTQVDMTQYYTKQEVNELPAVASGVTSTKVSNYDAHIANGDIHVTASDKATWNTVALIKQLRLVNAQVGSSTTIAFANIDDTNGIKVGDKCMDLDAKLFEITAVDTTNQTVTVGSALIDLALDANVMHLSGNETASGQKTFSDMSSFQGSYLGNEASANARSDLILESNRDTHGQSGIFLTKFRQNKAQGAMSGNDVAYLSYDCLENSVRTNNGFRINFLNFVDDIPQRFILWSGITERLLGVPNSPWSDVSTNKVNGINPGSLSLPNLNNGLDISGYIAVNTPSEYTALSNGYISICGTSSSTNAIAIKDKNFDYAVTGRALTISSVATTYVLIPVLSNHTYEIICSAVSSIVWAKFFPNLGNV